MPSRSCKTCDLAFPYRTEYEICPGCAGRTAALLTTDLRLDWEQRVKEFFDGMAESSDEVDRIIANRLGRFRDVGYDWDEAAELAAAFNGPERVDVTYVEKLVRQGATLEQAAKLA